MKETGWPAVRRVLTASAGGVLGLVLTLDPSAAQLPAPGPLHGYHWTSWLEGTWEGTLEGASGAVPYIQEFRIVSGGHAVLTTNRIGSGPQAYHGTGLFRYLPDSNTAVGHWVGSMPDTALGLGTLDGDRMTWVIERLGTTVERVRVRHGPDSMVTTNTTTYPDGSKTVSVERLERVGSVASASRPVG